MLKKSRRSPILRCNLVFFKKQIRDCESLSRKSDISESTSWSARSNDIAGGAYILAQPAGHRVSEPAADDSRHGDGRRAPPAFAHDPRRRVLPRHANMATMSRITSRTTRSCRYECTGPYLSETLIVTILIKLLSSLLLSFWRIKFPNKGV
jgi:hypothetical protein